jgi:hypothetical protein
MKGGGKGVRQQWESRLWEARGRRLVSCGRGGGEVRGHQCGSEGGAGREARGQRRRRRDFKAGAAVRGKGLSG